MARWFIFLLKTGLIAVAVPVILVCLPLIGVILTGKPLHRYLEFPPITGYVDHVPFSWPLFILLLVLVLVVLIPFIARFVRFHRRTKSLANEPSQAGRSCFPWWGWAGLALLVVSWLLAWTRFPCFSTFQAYTYFPLWLGYIITVNGLCRKRTSQDLLSREPLFFLLLFPMSGLFWWYFEYLNRFVQNWHYLGVAYFSTTEYVIHATICFSTVLPAVLSTKELLESFPGLLRPFGDWIRLDSAGKAPVKVMVGVLFFIPVVALLLLAVLPEYLFPFLWISPLFIISGLQIVQGRKTIFAPLKNGNWRGIVSSALAALICGFFWELWNSGSLAHWEYFISFVQRFHLFEMPALGYAGYLPFGLECTAIVAFLKGSTDEFCRMNA